MEQARRKTPPDPRLLLSPLISSYLLLSPPFASPPVASPPPPFASPAVDSPPPLFALPPSFACSPPPAPFLLLLSRRPRASGTPCCCSGPCPPATQPPAPSPLPPCRWQEGPQQQQRSTNRLVPPRGRSPRGGNRRLFQACPRSGRARSGNRRDRPWLATVTPAHPGDSRGSIISPPHSGERSGKGECSGRSPPPPCVPAGGPGNCQDRPDGAPCRANGAGWLGASSSFRQGGGGVSRAGRRRGRWARVSRAGPRDVPLYAGALCGLPAQRFPAREAGSRAVWASSRAAVHGHRRACWCVLPPA
jgi:hypothetical protein